ncbi:MAG: hypothetical protein H8E21_10165 [Gammaproteobacteria bacterium]|nr:hypothetical protein [Gammaproteobacteria bacterium]
MSSDSIILICIGLLLLTLFIVMAIHLGRNFRFMRQRQRKLADRIESLRLSKMLGLLNIPLKKYAAKTSDAEKARHIWACERCPNPDQCNQALAGKQIDADSFCPNYPRLKILKKD